jgi:lipid-A-disaccharide synthase-like uncharacterized protein
MRPDESFAFNGCRRGSLAGHTRFKPSIPLNLMFIPMASLGGLVVLIYFACIVAVIIYLLRLLGRFVSAHERMAASLEIIARKLKEDAKP